MIDIEPELNILRLLLAEGPADFASVRTLIRDAAARAKGHAIAENAELRVQLIECRMACERLRNALETVTGAATHDEAWEVATETLRGVTWR